MDVVSNIRAANVGREQERLQMKYEKMYRDPFVFLRGTCHLFYDRLPSHALFKTSPAVWCCGDLHLENFGSYKGNNRLIYFDINDFEEAALAPATWELVRMLSSIRLGAGQMNAPQLCAAFLEAYAAALVKGKAMWVERDTAEGLVKDLFEALQNRTRVKFLNKRTDTNDGRRSLHIDGEDVKWDKKRILPVNPKDRSRVEAAIATFAQTQQSPRFFEVLDVARRVAGTGSLGLGRFLVLVEGKGSPDENYLLDLKQSTTSTLVRHPGIKQLPDRTDAERIVELQKRLQAISAAFLYPLPVGSDSYVLRELQPTEDSVEWDSATQSYAQIEQLIQTMGRLVAWAQLRSAGRGGSATADRLIEFGGAADWRPTLLALSEDCAAQVRMDSAAFDLAYEQHAFEVV